METKEFAQCLKEINKSLVRLTIPVGYKRRARFAFCRMVTENWKVQIMQKRKHFPLVRYELNSIESFA